MRRAPAAVLLALSCVLASVSVVAMWMDIKVLRQSGYVEAVGSLGDEGVAADASADLITRRLLSIVPARVVAREYAKARNQPMPTDPVEAARLIVRRTVETAVNAGQFAAEWRAATVASYGSMREAVVGDVTGFSPRGNEGRVALDLTPTLLIVRAQLVQMGITAYQRATIEPGSVQLVLADLTALRDARSAVNTLVVGRWALPAAALVLLLIGLASAEHRLRALAWWGAGVALTLSLTLVTLWVTRHLLIDDGVADSVQDVQGAAFDALTASLRTALAVGVAVGAMLLVAATEVARGNQDDSHRI